MGLVRRLTVLEVIMISSGARQTLVTCLTTRTLAAPQERGVVMLITWARRDPLCPIVIAVKGLYMTRRGLHLSVMGRRVV